jgi:hypothetical protein
MTTTPLPEHRPMTILSGPALCIARECDEEPDGSDRCPHIREETVCTCSSELEVDGRFTDVTPWPHTGEPTR